MFLLLMQAIVLDPHDSSSWRLNTASYLRCPASRQDRSAMTSPVPWRPHPRARDHTPAAAPTAVQTAGPQESLPCLPSQPPGQQRAGRQPRTPPARRPTARTRPERDSLAPRWAAGSTCPAPPARAPSAASRLPPRSSSPRLAAHLLVNLSVHLKPISRRLPEIINRSIRGRVC